MVRHRSCELRFWGGGVDCKGCKAVVGVDRGMMQRDSSEEGEIVQLSMGAAS